MADDPTPVGVIQPLGQPVEDYGGTTPPENPDDISEYAAGVYPDAAGQLYSKAVLAGIRAPFGTPFGEGRLIRQATEALHDSGAELLDPVEANKLAPDLVTKVTAPISRASLAQRMEVSRRIKAEEAWYASGEEHGWAAETGMDLIAGVPSVLDPVNLAAMVFTNKLTAPYRLAKAAVAAGMASPMRRYAQNLAVEYVSNAAGMLASETIAFPQAKREENIKYTDILKSIPASAATATVVFGGLGFLGRGLAKAFGKEFADIGTMPDEYYRAALRKAVIDLERGQKINVEAPIAEGIAAANGAAAPGQEGFVFAPMAHPSGAILFEGANTAEGAGGALYDPRATGRHLTNNPMIPNNLYPYMRATRVRADAKFMDLGAKIADGEGKGFAESILNRLRSFLPEGEIENLRQNDTVAEVLSDLADIADSREGGPDVWAAVTDTLREQGYNGYTEIQYRGQEPSSHRVVITDDTAIEAQGPMRSNTELRPVLTKPKTLEEPTPENNIHYDDDVVAEIERAEATPIAIPKIEERISDATKMADEAKVRLKQTVSEAESEAFRKAAEKASVSIDPEVAIAHEKNLSAMAKLYAKCLVEGVI
jgi:hypothetical protein